MPARLLALALTRDGVGATVRDLDRQARSYRGERPPPDVAGPVVILVDDAP